MNHPPCKTRRLGELPQAMAPPHDGWPALEARLHASAAPQSERPATLGGAALPARRLSPRVMRIAALAAVLAALVIGLSVGRWVLAPSRPSARPAALGTQAGLPVGDRTDPSYRRERVALVRSLRAHLAALPPPTRRKVLESLAVIHQSIRQIEQALGREPGNTLLQELLIDSYQNEMQVLSTAQALSGGGRGTST
jgi:hypothetical protein